MMNYRVEYVNLENNHTAIQVYATIQDAIIGVSKLMQTSDHIYRITITSQSNG